MQPPVRIAVLECDRPVGWTKANYGTYGPLFSELLESGARHIGGEEGIPPPALDISHWDVYQAQVYPDPDDIDAVLMTGSHCDAFTDEPWIIKLVDYTRKLLAQGKVKVLGVCFGHQILGRALGAKVGRNDAWEVAVTPVALTQKGKNILKLEKLAIHQMHRDIVDKDLPQGVECLGSTDRCAVQVLYQKGRCFSTQGHPEFKKEIVSDLITARLTPKHEQYQDGMDRVANVHDGVAVSAAFIRFVQER